MIKDIETLGLKVESIRPSANKHEVDTITDVKVKFNAEVLAKTIVGNIALYEDSEGVFNGEVDPTKLTRVNGEISYESKTIIFKPHEELNENKQYIVVVKKDGIKDVLGRSLLLDNIFTFFTKANKALTKPAIIRPTNAQTITDNLVIEFTDIYDTYNVQISQNSEFDTLIVDDIVNTSNTPTVIYSPKTILDDGLYFIRIKAVGGVFSENVQIVVNRNIGVVSNEDYNNLLEEFEGKKVIDLLEYFPPTEKMGGVNLKSLYFKFNNELSIEDVNLNESYIQGELFDSTDNDLIQEHGYVDEKTIVVYDGEENATYVVTTIL